MFRDAVPKDVDVRFILSGGEQKDKQRDGDGLKCLAVDASEESGGVEAVIRKIEQEVWGAGSAP